MELTMEELKKGPMPQHIAVIMDGNGRWAKMNGLTRTLGHRAGVEALKQMIIALDELDIPYLTVYAFSTENWKRPSEEVQALMDLVIEFINREIEYLNEKGVYVHPIGDLDPLPLATKQKMYDAEAKTRGNTNIIFNVAFNYGGRQELLRAVKLYCEDVQEGKQSLETLDESTFQSYLYTANQPDPDLLIRSSGEFRISNFLLWQIAYTEVWISDVYWPDFRKKHLWQAIYDYQHRDRRYGGLSK